MRLGIADAGAPVFASIAAAHATHMTRAVGETFNLSGTNGFPVTLPIDEIVAGLNRVKPTVLMGYPSALFPLTHEARAGRLQIAPRLILPSSEPLLPEIRAALTNTWQAPILNVWGTTEACTTAMGCGVGEGMHVSED